MENELLNMGSNTLFNTLSLILAGISFLAIVLSVVTFIQSSKITAKVHSKEYQINEDLKYSILQVIATVRSIDAKAAVGLDIEKEHSHSIVFKPDYSLEMEMITKLQSSPGYLIFLNSIEDTKERFQIESLFRNISMRIENYDNFDIRRIAHMLMSHIEKGINKKLIKDENVYNQMTKLCKMEGVFTNIDFEEFEKKRDFILYLRNHNIIDDEFFISATLKEMKEKYHAEYENFLKRQKTT